MTDFTETVTARIHFDLKINFSNVAERITVVRSISTESGNRVEFQWPTPSRPRSRMLFTKPWGPSNSRRLRWCCKGFQLNGKTSTVGKLHETIVEIQIGRLHRHIVILAERGTVSSKCIWWGNYNEHTRSVSPNASKALPIRLSGCRDSNIETNSQMRNVDAEFKRGCGHDAPEASRLESSFNLLSIFWTVARAVRQNIFIIAGPTRHRQDFHAFPRIQKSDESALTSVVEHLVVQRLGNSAFLTDRTCNMRHESFRVRGAVIVMIDDRELRPREFIHVLPGIFNRCGCRHKLQRLCLGLALDEMVARRDQATNQKGKVARIRLPAYARVDSARTKSLNTGILTSAIMTHVWRHYDNASALKYVFAGLGRYRSIDTPDAIFAKSEVARHSLPSAGHPPQAL